MDDIDRIPKEIFEEAGLTLDDRLHNFFVRAGKKSLISSVLNKDFYRKGGKFNRRRLRTAWSLRDYQGGEARSFEGTPGSKSCEH